MNHPSLGVQAVIDSFPFYVLLVDEDHHILAANAKLRQALPPCAKVEGAYCPSLVHGMDTPFPGCPLEDAVAKGGVAIERDLHDKATGRWIRSAVYPTAIRTDSGRAVYLHTAIDISDERQANEENKRNQTIQRIASSVLSLSLGGSALEAILAASLDEILSVPWLALDKKGAFFLVDQQNPGGLVLVAQRGLAPPLLAACARVPLGRCLCGRAAATKEIVFANQVDQRHEITYDEMRPHGHYCVPVLAEDKVLGVLNLYVREGHVRSPRDEVFLTAMASALALCIERKRKDDKLRESESKYRDLFDNASDAILIADAEKAVILDANQAAETLLGRAKHEIIGINRSEIHPFRFHEEFKQHVGSGHVVDMESEVVRKDGTIVPVCISSKVIAIGGKKVIQGNFRDVTERKMTEHALEASEKRYRRLFETAMDGVLILDAASGKIVDVNPYLMQLMGYSHEDFLGKHLWEIGPFKDIVASKESFAELLAKKYVRYDDLPLKTSDGRKINVEFISNVYRVDNQEVIQCNVRDISARKLIEDEHNAMLLQQEGVNKLYQSLLVSATLDLKLKLITDSIVSLFYADFCRIWLIRKGDLCERGCIHALIKEGPHVCRYRDRCLHLVSSSGRYTHIDGKDHCRVPFGCYKIGMVASGEEHKFITNDVQHDPRVHNHEWARNLELVSFAGYQLKAPDEDTIGVIALFAKHPITSAEDAMLDGISSTVARVVRQAAAEEEQTNLEEQLRMSQKMEAIGSLAGGIAHDFNNLLSVILSYTVFVVDNMREGDSMRDDLLEVKKAAERAAALTRQLLAFSRKQVLQPVPLNLNEIAVGMEKMLRRILREDIELRQMLAPDLGLTLADPGQIEQVLMNLVVNARAAMAEGGKLTIETSNVEIDEEYAAHHVDVKPGRYVQLAVTDTGGGMDTQTKARIFEPFFTTKEKGKGTGLGLSTVYGIIKQSRGSISVYSELGQGTTFKIYLPRDLAATTATPTKPPMVQMQTTGTETILVVDDEEALRKVAIRTLEAAGYTVLTAADGDEAILVSARHMGDIHLLLTDVVMPRMSGRTLAQELSKTRPTLEVLYMSGYTDDAIVHHGVLDAGTHFLGKPFTAASLTQKVREVLDRGVTNLADEHKHVAKADAAMNEQPLGKNALRKLPQDILGKLRKAVIAARYDEMVEIIETIRITEPDVATGLRRMTDLFDYAGILDLLRQGKEEQSGK